MVEYVLTRRIYNTLTGRGFNLVCKLCNLPLQVNDEVESKPSKYRKRKFYHKSCYEDCHIDLGGKRNGKNIK